MRVVKWLLGIVVVLGAGLWFGGYLLPSTFQVTRSARIGAPVEKVYPLIAEPRRWKEWGAWNRRDPAMQITYTGPPSGPGAAWEWKSRSEGDGKMTFTAATPNEGVDFDLYFPDFGTTSKGRIRLAPDGAGTQVTWAMDGDMGRNPLLHWMSLFADAMVGKDFDEGLANLKRIAETK